MLQRIGLGGMGTWGRLVIAWLTITPVWAVVTAWLGAPLPERAPDDGTTTTSAEVLRYAMCAAGVAFLCALAWGDSWTWIPLVALAWALGVAADIAESGWPDAWLVDAGGRSRSC